jgi:SagB-type dehydrogenase family enzyme
MQKMDKQVIRKLTSGAPSRVVRPAPSLSELFHENTKITPSSGRELGLWTGYVGRSPMLRGLMSRPHKVFSLMDCVPLSEARPIGELEETICARRSVRKYTGGPLSQEELSRLLYFSYGVTDPRSHFRAVSSGGGLYPLDVYAFVLRVEGLARGLYHYDAEHHRLDQLSLREFESDLKSAAWLSDIDADNLSVLFVVTATFARTTVKYRDRGYRLVLMEAGEVAQNMSLMATRLSLGACVLGGFQDDALSRLLEIDGCDEAPLLLVAVGRHRQ